MPRYRVVYRDATGEDHRTTTMDKALAVEAARDLADAGRTARVIRTSDGAELLRCWRDPRTGVRCEEHAGVSQRKSWT